LCVVVASFVQDEEVVEWSEASALVWPGPAEALVHALLTTDRMTRHDLHPLCHCRTGPHGQVVILHMMTF
jgi:hypothetical protein